MQKCFKEGQMVSRQQLKNVKYTVERSEYEESVIALYNAVEDDTDEFL